MPDPSPSPSASSASPRMRPRRIVLTFGGKRSSLPHDTSTPRPPSDPCWTPPLSCPRPRPIFDMQAYDDEGEDELDTVVRTPSSLPLSIPAREDPQPPASESDPDVDMEASEPSATNTKETRQAKETEAAVPLVTRRSTRPRPQSQPQPQPLPSTLALPTPRGSVRKPSTPSRARRNSARGRSSTFSNPSSRLTSVINSDDSSGLFEKERAPTPDDADALDDQLFGSKNARPRPRPAELALYHQGMDPRGWGLGEEECRRLCKSEYAWRLWKDTDGSGIKALDLDGYDAQGRPRKPELSYDQMIRMCITGGPTPRMTLQELLSAIELRWPWFRENNRGPQGWQNTVRHTLTTNHHYVNTVRGPGENGEGRGGWWSINNEAGLPFQDGNRKQHRCRSKQTPSISVSPGVTGLSSSATPNEPPKPAPAQTAKGDAPPEGDDQGSKRLASDGTRRSAMQLQAIVHQVDGGSYAPLPPAVSKTADAETTTLAVTTTTPATVPLPQNWASEEFRHGTRRWLQQHPASYSSAYSPGPALLKPPSEFAPGHVRADEAIAPAKRRKTNTGSVGARECPPPRFEHGRPAYPSPPVVVAQNARAASVSMGVSRAQEQGKVYPNGHYQPPPGQARPVSRESAASGPSRQIHAYPPEYPADQQYAHAAAQTGRPHLPQQPRAVEDPQNHTDARVPYTSYFPRQTQVPAHLTHLVGPHASQYAPHSHPAQAHDHSYGPYHSHRQSPQLSQASRPAPESRATYETTAAPPRRAFPGVEAMMKGERPGSVSPTPIRPAPLRGLSDISRISSEQQHHYTSQRTSVQAGQAGQAAPPPLSLGALLNDIKPRPSTGTIAEVSTTKARSHSTSQYRWPEGTLIPARLESIGRAPSATTTHHPDVVQPAEPVFPSQRVPSQVGQHRQRPLLHVDTTRANRHQEYTPPVVAQQSQNMTTLLPLPQRRVHPPAHPLQRYPAHAAHGAENRPSVESLITVKQALYGSGTPAREERWAR